MSGARKVIKAPRAGEAPRGRSAASAGLTVADAPLGIGGSRGYPLWVRCPLALALILVSLGCKPDAPPQPAAPSPAADPAEDPPAAADPAPAARPPVAAEFPLDGARIVLPAPITFDADGAALSPAADPALYHLLDYLSAKESVSLVRIEGHAPEQALSEARALTVARWLVAHGVACERLVPIGFGPTKPVADASTPEGRAANVRIDAINAALRGRLIGGMPADGGGQLAGDPCR
ncbi:MAG: OmpA family protein [Nannocystis sp.]|nr:OmpA family protein [Nannocystis sp.]